MAVDIGSKYLDEDLDALCIKAGDHIFNIILNGYGILWLSPGLSPQGSKPPEDEVIVSIKPVFYFTFPFEPVKPMWGNDVINFLKPEVDSYARTHFLMADAWSYRDFFAAAFFPEMEMNHEIRGKTLAEYNRQNPQSKLLVFPPEFSSRKRTKLQHSFMAIPENDVINLPKPIMEYVMRSMQLRYI